MHKKIAVLSGDGIGREITGEAVKILQKIAGVFGHNFVFVEGLIGAAAIESAGTPLPDKTLDVCLQADAVLLGAIGDPKYADPTEKIRPEQGLLKLRQELGLYANLRPIYTFASLIAKSPLKPEVIKDVDFIVVRELTGGIYFGERGRSADGKQAFDTNSYTIAEIERVSRYAFELAMKRKSKLMTVDKANVLETSRLWREAVGELAADYPGVELSFLYVDNAAMQIIKRPSEFDVILTENMFGDILTDEASVITGSLGMLPSASIGEKTSLFEPIHGSFPRAAGKNIANPTGTILSAAMLLEYAFELTKEAQAVRQAVERAVSEGHGTRDIVEKNPLSTSEFGNKVAGYLQNGAY